jgi:hypothetical protein
MSEQPRFYELGQFLGGYFHQDWMHIKLRPDWTPENADAESVVRSFIEQSPPELLKTIAGKIDELLALCMSEDELEKFLYTEFGFYYMPTADGISYADWLRSVRDQLSASCHRAER